MKIKFLRYVSITNLIAVADIIDNSIVARETLF
jgi:hypothetical protein